MQQAAVFSRVGGSWWQARVGGIAMGLAVVGTYGGGIEHGVGRREKGGRLGKGVCRRG